LLESDPSTVAHPPPRSQTRCPLGGRAGQRPPRRV